MKNNFMNFSSNLKWLLDHSNVSRKKLAQLIGVEQSSISHYTNKKSMPNFIILEKITKIFSVTLDQLCFADFSKDEAVRGHPNVHLSMARSEVSKDLANQEKKQQQRTGGMVHEPDKQYGTRDEMVVISVQEVIATKDKLIGFLERNNAQLQTDIHQLKMDNEYLREDNRQQQHKIEALEKELARVKGIDP